MAEIYSYSATVRTGNWNTYVRAQPSRSAPLAGSQILPPNTSFKVTGWTYGECVEGECRWWVSQYGNYVWVGATIEKPPGTPTPPTPTPVVPTPTPSPTPAPTPTAPKEYKVTAPHVSFSEVITPPFMPAETVEVRAFNVDDIARVYLDGNLILEVRFGEDKKVKIHPGLSYGNHELRLTLENTAGGWTYGFQIIRNGNPVWTKADGEAGKIGAKNNDLGIGTVVDIRLGISAATAPIIGGVIEGTIENITSSIQQAQSTIATNIQEASTKPILDRIWETLKDIGNWFKDLFDKIGKLLADSARIVFEFFDEKGWVHGIFTKIKEILDLISRDFREFILDPLGKIKEKVIEALRVAKDWLVDLTGWISEIVKRVWEAGRNIVQNVGNWVYENIWQKLEELWRNTKETIKNVVHEIIDPLGDTFRWIWEKIRDFFGDVFDRLIHHPLKTISDFLKSIADFILNIGDHIRKWIESIAGYIWTLLQPWYQIYVNTLSTVARWGGAVTAALVAPIFMEALTDMQRVIQPAWGREADIHISIDALGENIYRTGVTGIDMAIRIGTLASFWATTELPIVNTHLRYIGGLLADIGNWRWAIYGLFTSWARHIYEIPANYYYRAKYRPILPRWRDVALMYQRGYISDEIFYKRYQFEGWSDYWFENIKKISKRPLDPFSFAFLSQTGYFDKEEVDKLTTEMGYLPHVKDYLVKAPMMWGLSPFKTSIRTRIMNGVSNGFLLEETAVAILEPLWKILTMSEIMRAEAITRYWYEMTKDRVDYLIDSYVKGTISREELERGLTSGDTIHLEAEEPGKVKISVDLPMYVVNKERLKYYLDLAELKKAKKPQEERLPEQKRFILSALTDLYVSGAYDLEKFVSTLKKADEITDFIELAKLRADLEREYREFKLSQGRTETEVTNYLSTIAGILVSEYSEGAIDLDTLKARLAEAEKITDKVTAYIKKAEYERELEEFRERKKQEKDTTRDYISIVASTLINCYQEGAISKEELEYNLTIAEQITDKKAAYILKAQWEKFLTDFREKKRQEQEELTNAISLLASTIISCYKKGYISPEERDGGLDLANQLMTKKVAYILKAQWEQFEAQMDKGIDLLFDSLSKDLITEGTFYDQLMNLGIQPWRIEQLMTEYEIKNYGKSLTYEQKWLTSYRACIGILNKIKEAGFMSAEQVAREKDKLKAIVPVLDLVRLRRQYETFYDDRKIAIEVLNEQYKDGLIDDAKLYEELKKYIVVQTILDATFLAIVGKAKPAKK